MATPTTFVGIDVGKSALDLAQRPDGTIWHGPNDETGWAVIIALLAGRPSPLIVLEASGGYEAGLVFALDTAGMTPVVTNPVATRRFAQSLGKRAKTDRIDAAMLATYAERMQPSPRPLPDATARQLRELLTRRAAVTKMLVEERNRQHRTSDVLRPQLTATIALFEAQRAELDALMASVIAADPDWQVQVEHVRTVPGFGMLSATILLMGLRTLEDGTAKEAASHFGIAPHPHDSGTLHARRHISAGRADVRQTLYESMITTIRCEPTFQAHYRQLRARGKAHKQAMIACARRLLGIVMAMLRDGLTWQETKVGRGVFLPTPA